MKRAAAYARVSSDHQSETSIETQLKTIHEFCKSHNIVVVDEYFEKQSGSDSLNERKEFTKMIEKALNGAYDLVVVDKFDRFFRNDVEDRIVTRRLEEKGVLVLSATEGVDVSSPTGRLMRWIISDINSFYRDNLRSEIQRKVIAVAKRGYWLGGKPPLGYKLEEVVDNEGRHRKKLALDENEAPIIRFIFEQFNSGMSYRKVAQALNEKGVKTRRGKEFNANSVYEIICNPRYYGANVYNRGKKSSPHFHRDDTVIVENAIPAIVSKDEWQKANARHRPSQRKSKEHYLLRGIIKCGDCGGPMVGDGSGKYICQNWRAGKSVKYVGIAKKKVENFVLEYIRHEVLKDLTDKDFDEMAKEINERAAFEDAAKQKKIDEMTLRKKEIESEMSNIVEAIAKGVLIEKMRARAEELEKEEKEIDSKINELKSMDFHEFTNTDILKKRWQHLKEMLVSDDDDLHEELIKSVISNVKVYPKGFIKIEEKESTF